MATNFSPSVNIVRDAAKTIHYIPTNNSKQIYASIASNFDSGLHSFTIIGSYGTGKSAFIVALERTLNGQQIFFKRTDGSFNNLEKFRFENIVGSTNSIIGSIAEHFGVEDNNKAVLKHIKSQRQDDECLVLVIDEFGKFLEYAATNNPDKELYFVQQLAELANDETSNLIFITTLHQNFDAYALKLEESQRKEWEKVKGRLKELTFNEPVEQLLALAAERLTEKYKKEKKNKLSSGLIKVIKENNIFPLRNQLDKSLAERLYPFDVLSAATLAIALQRYGQNERSLFTFLDTDDYKGLQQYDKAKNPFFNLGCIYDYFYHNYFSILTNRNNHDYRYWTLIRNTLDRVETQIEDENVQHDALALVKTIGLLNALGSKGGKINQDFLKRYAKECLGIEDVSFLLGQLQGLQVVKYLRYRDSYILYEGSDIDIEGELDKLRSETEPVKNIANELKQFLPLDYASAKAASYKKGTPRFFQFEISEAPLKVFNGDEIDGFVNLIFTDEEVESEILDIKGQAILHALFVETPNIKKELYEIKIVDKLFKQINDHKDPAKIEVGNERDYRVLKLKNYLNNSLFDGSYNVKWFFNGEEVEVNNRTSFNKALSFICDTVYHKTPVLQSELINRHKLSGNISLARKNLIARLVNNHEVTNLGFKDAEFPPEKSIYYTLLKNTGIHKEGKLGVNYFGEPTEASFKVLWDTCADFLQSATVARKPLSDLLDLLSQKPYKLKRGFLEYWIPIYLFITREQYALYYNNNYVPFLNKDILDIILKNIQRYEIKTFHIEGVKLSLFNKYRELIRQPEEQEVGESTFINTVKPFIVFYKRVLNDYARRTNRISDDAKAFRNSVKEAKELEKVFFEDLLTNFGVSMNDLASSEDKLNDYVKRLRNAMTELTNAYPELVERIENNLKEELGITNKDFKAYIKDIRKRYDKLKPYLLTDKQKVFRARLFNQFEEPEKYYSSICSALVGKSLDAINDEEEFKLHDKMKQSLRELDNLLEMANLEIKEKEEKAVQIEITSFNKQPVKHKVILSKTQSKKAASLEEELKTILSRSDSKIAKAVLIKLLEEQINGK